MNIFSAFDGISCGRVAADKANLKVDNYFSSEVCDYSIKISKKNYPEIIQVGDVRNIDPKKFNNIDLLIGGSPCTNMSFIGSMAGMVTKNKIEVTTLKQYLELKEKNFEFVGQSYLFWEYVRLLKEINPTYFLLENVKMSKKWERVITDTLGVEPKKIDSALVSAQHRERLYWTNIPNVSQPNDKHIELSDILDDSLQYRNTGEALTIQKNMDIIYNKYGYIPQMFNCYNRQEITRKSPTLSTGSMVTSSCAVNRFCKKDYGIYKVINGVLLYHNKQYNTYLEDGNYIIRELNINEREKLQTLDKDYTCVDDVSVCNRGKAIGNGWTVDIVTGIFNCLPNKYKI